MNKIPFIKKGYSGGMDFHEDKHGYGFFTLFFFFTAIGLVFFVLLLRLFQLTIVKGDYYRRLSEDNRIHEVTIEAQRGTIIDRRGMVLAENEPADIASDEARYNSKREYSSPEAFAPVIGYRQLADQSDFNQDNCVVKLDLGDKVGKKGVEKLFDCSLRGKAGKKLIEVNARGTMVRTLDVIQPEKGQTVQLSLDGDLQKAAYDQIKKYKAAVVAMRPSTGEVLVLASSPSFDPQAFEDGKNSLITQYFTDNSKPMFNRATEGMYPPGSTFKLVVASGALEEKDITPDSLIDDTGYIQAGSLKFANWEYDRSGKKEGLINVVTAIKHSNDVFFYNVGAKMGPEKIKDWAEKFGMNQTSNLGIEESAGTVPYPFWKEETLKEQWYTGDTYNFSIGQGYLLVTPLQIARVTQALANRGNLCKPSILKVGSQTNAELLDPYEMGTCSKLPISQNTLNTVKEGMKEACSPGGTAYPLFNFEVNDPTRIPTDQPASGSAKVVIPKKKIDLACKTGTAESDQKSPYAWLTVYGPVENPEIALTVMVEEGGEGSDVAAPIAKEILKSYFERIE